MSRRAHAALWIAGIVLALGGAPLLWTASDVPSFEAGTRAWLAGTDPRIATSAKACADAVTSGWGQPAGGDRSAARTPAGVGLRVLGLRWLATWRIVVLRMALSACAVASCWPILLAGLVDGLAMRRARRGRFPAVSPLASAAASHAMIVLVFAPVLWAALPLGAGALVLPAWSLACAGTLSFALSR